ARGDRAHALLLLRRERSLDQLLQQGPRQRRVEAGALGIGGRALEHLALAREVAQQAALRALDAPDLRDPPLAPGRELDPPGVDAVQRLAQLREIHGRLVFLGEAADPSAADSSVSARPRPGARSRAARARPGHPAARPRPAGPARTAACRARPR